VQPEPDPPGLNTNRQHLNSLITYWTAFSTQIDTVEDDVFILENREFPFLEANAGYPFTRQCIPTMNAWFEAKDRPGVLILPAGSELELQASRAGFAPYSSTNLLWLQADANLETPVWVEQVPWNLARAVGEVIAVAKGANAWAEQISTEVARAMQSNSNLTAYLAFHADQPVGALLALNNTSLLWGVTRPGANVGATATLTNHAALEMGTLRLSAQKHELELFQHPQILERFVAWVKKA
jgi:hypothetical protein